MLVYLGGMSNFIARCKEVAEGYEGFDRPIEGDGSRRPARSAERRR